MAERPASLTKPLSSVWDHWTRFEQDGKARAKCNFCHGPKGKGGIRGMCPNATLGTLR